MAGLQSQTDALKRQLEHVMLQREHYRGLLAATAAASSSVQGPGAIAPAVAQALAAFGPSPPSPPIDLVHGGGRSRVPPPSAPYGVSAPSVAGVAAGGNVVGGAGSRAPPSSTAPHFPSSTPQPHRGMDTPARGAATFAASRGGSVGGWVPSTNHATQGGPGSTFPVSSQPTVPHAPGANFGHMATPPSWTHAPRENDLVGEGQFEHGHRLTTGFHVPLTSMDKASMERLGVGASTSDQWTPLGRARP